MACVISPVLLRQTPFRYTETLMQRRCNVWQPRMTDEHGLNWHDDTVCCFDLPFCLQNGPVINLERSLKADELIRTATQLRSLPLFVWPISPFMSWDPQLSATLVSTVPFFFRTLLILIILLNRFLLGPPSVFEQEMPLWEMGWPFALAIYWWISIHSAGSFCWLL